MRMIKGKKLESKKNYMGTGFKMAQLENNWRGSRKTINFLKYIGVALVAAAAAVALFLVK